MGKASTPPAPDYTAAAEQTAAGNLENSRVTTKANRVNTYTPYGSLTYSQDPNDPDKWSSNIQFSPEQQQLLNQQNQTSAGLAGLQDSATARVGQALNSPYASVYDPTKNTNQATDLILSRLAPQFQRDENALENKLVNQGLMRGSEAFDQAMNQFGQHKNDAYTQAALQGINLGQSQQQLQYQQEMANRNAPINELSAIRSGSQVTNPSFQNAPAQTYTGGANYSGAANSQYQSALDAANAQNAASGNFMNGLFSLGGSALGASSVPWWLL